MNLLDHTASLFILYLVVSGNFLAPLLSCRVQTYIMNSMIVRHLLGYLTMTFFVVLANQKDPLDLEQLFLISAGLYTWFLATCRMNLGFWTLTVVLLAFVYILQIYQNNQESRKESKEFKDNIESVKKVLGVMIAGLTVVGVLLYYGEKRIEYGQQFDTLKFILGNPECRHYSPQVSAKQALQALRSR
jgi:uncharacterized membrane protein